VAVCPVIFASSGPELTTWERDFFADADPLGFILFARNCMTPGQVSALVADFRQAVGRADAPVLIDQEGGRVQRLRPPEWRAAPPAARFGALAETDPAGGREAARMNARLIGDELAALGIDVDCAPVLDLRRPETHAAIGDRAFGSDPALVAELGRAVCEGLEAAGVQPVIKHLPGHGRAWADSHLELPRVSASRAELEASDFEAFRRLSDVTWAMTAHIVFEAVDPDRSATVSPVMIQEVIRGSIGFGGVLVGDDLSMEALSGTLAERTGAVLAAGCDLVLHCTGRAEEMPAVAEAAGTISPQTRNRLERAAKSRPAGEPLSPQERADIEARLDAMLPGG
jgi:beta-N-acetylhexosaminidase